MVFCLKIAQEITPDDLFDSSRALPKKKRKKEKKRAKSSTALTALMCAYFKSPDLIRKNNLNLCFDLTGQGYYYKANCSFITTVHLIDLIQFWKKCPWIVCNIFC